MGIALPPSGLGCSRMVMGEAGLPQGVSMCRFALGVKPGMDSRPVPPMTPIRMGSGEVSELHRGGKGDRYLGM